MGAGRSNCGLVRHGMCVSLPLQLLAELRLQSPKPQRSRDWVRAHQTRLEREPHPFRACSRTGAGRERLPFGVSNVLTIPRGRAAACRCRPRSDPSAVRTARCVGGAVRVPSGRHSVRVPSGRHSVRVPLDGTASECRPDGTRTAPIHHARAAVVVARLDVQSRDHQRLCSGPFGRLAAGGCGYAVAVAAPPPPRPGPPPTLLPPTRAPAGRSAPGRVPTAQCASGRLGGIHPPPVCGRRPPVGAARRGGVASSRPPPAGQRRPPEGRFAPPRVGGGGRVLRVPPARAWCPRGWGEATLRALLSGNGVTWLGVKRMPCDFEGGGGGVLTPVRCPCF